MLPGLCYTAALYTASGSTREKWHRRCRVPAKKEIAGQWGLWKYGTLKTG